MICTMKKEKQQKKEILELYNSNEHDFSDKYGDQAKSLILLQLILVMKDGTRIKAHKHWNQKCFHLAVNLPQMLYWKAQNVTVTHHIV